MQLAALLRLHDVSHRHIAIQTIPFNTLKLAQIHRGNKSLCLEDLPVIPTLERVNITSSDGCIIDARGVIASYHGYFIYTENKAFHYAEHEGIWKAMSKDNFLKYLAVDFYKDAKSPKEVSLIFNALKMIQYQDNFPRCEDKHNVIAFGNCSFIPETQTEIKHSPKHYSRHKVAYGYDKNATCPRWLAFLEQIFGQNDDYHDKVKLLQEYIGLSLTNITKFQKMLMLIGIGSNGKSVILKIVGALIGEGNVSKVSLKDLNNKFNLVGLNGKLVNIDCDLDVDSLNSDAIFKAIVAGEEMVLENKFERTFKTPVEVKLWAAGNAFPNVKNDSHGYYRRLIPLMFTRVFSEEEQDRELEHELEKELSGILNWALEGLKRLLDNKNFTIPESSHEALLDYKNANNPVTRFFNDYLELIDIKGSPTAGILCSKVFNAYKIFSTINGFSGVSDSLFGTKLKTLSVTVGKSNGKRYYSVKVREDVIKEKVGDDAMQELTI